MKLSDRGRGCPVPASLGAEMDLEEFAETWEHVRADRVGRGHGWGPVWAPEFGLSRFGRPH